MYMKKKRFFLNDYSNEFTLFNFRRTGKKPDIEKTINAEYLGEIPPNSPFCYSVGNTELVFIVIDPENPLAGYHAMRAALLHVIGKIGVEPLHSRARTTKSTEEKRLSVSTDQSYRTSSKKNLKIPDAFKGQTKDGGSSSPTTTTQGSTSPVVRAHSNTVCRPKNYHVTFSLSVVTKLLTQNKIIWQMSVAYHSMLTCKSNATPISKLEKRYKKCLNPPEETEEQRERKFVGYVQREELVRRGILGNQELNWLLNFFSDGASLPIQLAAATSVIQYIQCDK